MVKFNQLEIKDNKLIIDVSILDFPELQDIYLDSISIYTQDNYGDSNSVPNYYIGVSGKNVRLIISEEDLNDEKLITALNNNLFFITVECLNNIGEAEADESFTSAVFDYNALYLPFMNVIKSINNNNKIPTQFIDLFLRLQALKISIDTNHFIEAIDIYNKYIKDLNSTVNENNYYGEFNIHYFK